MRYLLPVPLFSQLQNSRRSKILLRVWEKLSHVILRPEQSPMNSGGRLLQAVAVWDRTSSTMEGHWSERAVIHLLLFWLYRRQGFQPAHQHRQRLLPLQLHRTVWQFSNNSFIQCSVYYSNIRAPDSDITWSQNTMMFRYIYSSAVKTLWCQNVTEQTTRGPSQRVVVTDGEDPVAFANRTSSETDVKLWELDASRPFPSVPHSQNFATSPTPSPTPSNKAPPKCLQLPNNSPILFPAFCSSAPAHKLGISSMQNIHDVQKCLYECGRTPKCHNATSQTTREQWYRIAAGNAEAEV